MGFLRKLLGGNSPASQPAESTEDARPPEHAVIIYFDNYGGTDLDRLHQVEDRLLEVIEKNGLGEYDGHEINVAGTDGTLYMYGPNADAIFEAIKPILFDVDWLKEAKVRLRYGPPEDGVKERRIKLQP